MIQKHNWKYIAGFNIFNILDAALTILATTYLGAVELNPLMSYLLNYNRGLFILLKLLLGLGVTIYCIKKLRWTLLKIACILMLSVVVWNIGMIIFKYGATHVG